VCGIFAEWRGGAGKGGLSDARARLTLLAHRGPDGDGLIGWGRNSGFVEQGDAPVDVVLGHRRLSIIDLTDGGRQPMMSPDGRFCLTFNGEIYNYLELRAELVTRHGRKFSSQSDTEVLLAAWDEWGVDCLTRLDGMFAFVLLDVRERRLFAVRDPFGIKPLHYTSDEEGYRFASEIKPLILNRAPTANTEQLFSFLRWGAIDGDEQTFFADVRQVAAAEFLTIDLDTGNVSKRRYWEARAQRSRTYDRDAVLDDFRTTFLQTVDRQLRADVPVVATLSGGLDSSAICGAVRHLHPDAPIKVFSYVAEGQASEERWIDIVGREKRLDVVKIHVDESRVLQELPALIKSQEQPFGSGSIYAQYKIFEAIAGHGYRVMLDGQGADESLAGYKSMLPNRLYDLISGGRLQAAARLYFTHARRDPGSRMMIAKRTARLFTPHAVMPLARRAAGRELALPFARAEWFESRSLSATHDEARQFADARSLDDALLNALGRDVLPALLRYSDRNAMAFSVENRVPYLSTPLVEAAFSLPADLLISPDGRTKAALRDGLGDLLPDAIRTRHDKVGFRATEEQWMRSDARWTRDALAAAESLPFVDPASLRATTDEFLAGDDRHGQALFRLIVLRMWSEEFHARFD
jgi:asparagine synthase (glutamine-hydrolysing)